MPFTNKFNVGDTVRVVRKVDSYNHDWETCWVAEMTLTVGMLLRVLRTGGNNGYDLSNGFNYPEDALELYVPYVYCAPGMEGWLSSEHKEGLLDVFKLHGVCV